MGRLPPGPGPDARVHGMRPQPSRQQVMSPPAVGRSAPIVSNTTRLGCRLGIQNDRNRKKTSKNWAAIVGIGAIATAVAIVPQLAATRQWIDQRWKSWGGIELPGTYPGSSGRQIPAGISLARARMMLSDAARLSQSVQARARIVVLQEHQQSARRVRN